MRTLEKLDKAQKVWYNKSSNNQGAKMTTKKDVVIIECPRFHDKEMPTSCEFCGSDKLDIRMNSIVCSDCGRKIGDIIFDCD